VTARRLTFHRSITLADSVSTESTLRLVIRLPLQKKVFAYVMRITDDRPELLVFDSFDEIGFEVPKGGVERGESLEQAVRRELMEETGISNLRMICELGALGWRNEHQHFFLVETSAGPPRSFEHVVTGSGIDAGCRYRFSWLPIDETLRNRLVQGSGRCIDRLLAHGLVSRCGEDPL